MEFTFRPPSLECKVQSAPSQEPFPSRCCWFNLAGALDPHFLWKMMFITHNIMFLQWRCWEVWWVLFSLRDRKVKLCMMLALQVPLWFPEQQNLPMGCDDSGEECHSSHSPFIQVSAVRSRLCSGSSFANELLGTWHSLLPLNNVRSADSAPYGS